MERAERNYSFSAITEVGRRRKTATQRSLFDYFLPVFPYYAQVLEVGPGRGEFAEECRNRQLSYIGVEPSRSLYELLHGAGFEVINKEVPPLPVESERFDLVHSNDFVEHLCSFREVMTFFQETHRVLRPGGYVSVIAPNYQTIKHLFFQYEYQHSYVTTADRLTNMLADCGFKIIKVRCFLMWLSPRLNWLDRLVAHALIPLTTNALAQGLIGGLTSKDFLFRIHKNVFDHVAVLARKAS